MGGEGGETERRENLQEGANIVRFLTATKAKGRGCCFFMSLRYSYLQRTFTSRFTATLRGGARIVLQLNNMGILILLSGLFATPLILFILSYLEDNYPVRRTYQE